MHAQELAALNSTSAQTSVFSESPPPFLQAWFLHQERTVIRGTASRHMGEEGAKESSWVRSDARPNSLYPGYTGHYPKRVRAP